MKDIFAQIETLIPTMNGWCTVRKAECMAALVLATRPTLCIELGTYAGRSAVPVALALKHNGHGMLIGVDPYSPEESAKHESQASAEWWGKLSHSYILEEFQGHIHRLGLQNVIRLERMTSDQFQPPDNIDLFHCDGSHGPQALTDVRRYCPKIRIGGFVVMDDINWNVNGQRTVDAAVQWLLGNGFIRLYDMISHHNIPNQPQDDWALFQRVK